MKKCVIIYNPKSGKLRTDSQTDKIKEVLNKYDYDLKIIYTRKKGDAINITKNLKYVDLLIACGGDGTLNEVITGNFKRKEKLNISHLPIGTTNDVGNMYGFTKNMLKNLKLLLEGELKIVDICLLNNKPFIYVSCFGNYVNVPFKTPRELKKRFGRLGYIIYGLKEIKGRIKKSEIKYTINEKTYNGKYSFIFITNSSRIAGVEGIYNDVKLNDNMFEVVLCDVSSKSKLLSTLYSIVTKDINKVDGITYFKTDNLKIEFIDKPISSWCCDGEEFKSNKKIYNFSVQKNMSMLIPKKNVKKLFINEV